MFAELALRVRGAIRGHADASGRRSIGELERTMRDAAAAHFGGMPVSVLSVTCADDGRYVDLECGIEAPGAEVRCDRAALAIASALDPVTMGARHGAPIRVRFARDGPV